MKSRRFSFGMVLVVGFLLLVSLVITAGLAVLGKFVGEILPMPELLLHTINFVVSFAGISALFALIFTLSRARYRASARSAVLAPGFADCSP
jgi:membrane protein